MRSILNTETRGRSPSVPHLRIVHVISYFQPHLGYQEYFLAREQARAGHETFVLTSDRYYPFSSSRHSIQDRLVREQVVKSEGFTTIRLRTFFEVGSINYCRRLSDVLGRIDPDVVHSHEIYTIMPAQVLGLRNAMRFGWLVDSHPHIPPFRSAHGRIVFGFLKRALYSSALKSADSVVAVSDSSKAWLVKEFPWVRHRVKTIPLGVESGLFSPSAQKAEAFKQRANLTTNHFVVLYAGQIEPLRGIPVLVKAFRLLLRERPDSVLVLIGNGAPEYVKYIRSLVQGLPTVLLNRITREELSGAFNAADVVVFPGGRSVSIYEAMSCGTPVVVYEGTDTLSFEASYLSTGAVLGFEKGNSRALHSVLLELSSNPDIADRLSANGVKAGKALDWSIISELFVREYQRIAP